MTDMLIIIPLFAHLLLTVIYCAEPAPEEEEGKDKEKEKGKEEEGPSECKNQYNVVELSPNDKESLKGSPKDSAIAKEFNMEHLVPVRIVTTYMRPDANGVLCGVPQNVMLAFIKLKEQMAQSNTESPYNLFKGEAAKLLGKSDDKKKDDKKEEEGGEEPPAE